MPYKRAYSASTRRPAKRTRSAAYQSPSRQMVPRGLGASGITTITRSLYSTASVTDAVNPSHGTMYSTLDILPNYTEFTALWDMYRIVKVSHMFRFDRNSANIPASNSATGSFMPNLYCVIDYDDSTALTSITDYLQYNPCKIWQLGDGKDHSISYTPHVAPAVYNGAFTGYGNEKLKWIDAGSPSVQHYGLKWCVDATLNGGTGTITLGHLSLYTTITLELKMIR